MLSHHISGFRATTWSKLPAAAPLFAGQAEYSTMMVPSAENTTFFVLCKKRPFLAPLARLPPPPPPPPSLDPTAQSDPSPL